tara:strand:- start:823 stop:1035 length:213 start_codon:yes stop_codon:yes gene_type:complete
MIQSRITEFNFNFNKIESPYGWAFAKLTKNTNGELTNEANNTLNSIANLDIIKLAPKIPNQPPPKKRRRK